MSGYNRNNNYDNDDGNYGPYSTGKSRSGQGDRRLDGGHDGRKKPGGNNPQGNNGYSGSNNRNQNRNYNNQNRNNNNQNRNYNNQNNYNNDDESDYDEYNNEEGQHRYFTRSQGLIGGGNHDDDDYSDNQNDGHNAQGGLRKGSERRLDGGYDGRKRPGGNNPEGNNGYTSGNNRNRGRSQSRNRNNNRGGNYNNYSDNDDDDDYSDDNNNNYQGRNQGQGQYGPYSTGKARSGQGDRRIDGGHDGRKKPGGNNPQGYNGYSGGNNNNSNNNSRNRNRNYQNDQDDDYDSEDYNQAPRKQRNNNNNNNSSYNTTGRQNRSGPGDRRLDGGPDRRKKGNRSDNYDENY